MNRIKELREEKGLKQGYLEKKLKLYPSQLHDWENEFKYPNVIQAIKLAKQLDTTVEELYVIEEDK